MVVDGVAAALDTVSGIEEVVFSSGSSSLFVEADLLGDLERVTANSGGTVQLESADSWTSGTSVGGYTLYTAMAGAQLWIDEEATIEFV